MSISSYKATKLFAKGSLQGAQRISGAQYSLRNARAATALGFVFAGKPVTPPPPALAVSSVVASSLSIAVSFNQSVLALGSAALPSSWSVQPAMGVYPVTVMAVSVAGSVITLTTTEQTNGGSYTLNLPGTGIARAFDGALLTSGFAEGFTGVGVGPTILFANVIDERTVDIIYSTVVVVSDALNIANYSVNHGLSVTAVSQTGSNSYQLTTTPQTQGLVYTLTVTGVHDLAGNST